MNLLMAKVNYVCIFGILASPDPPTLKYIFKYSTPNKLYCTVLHPFANNNPIESSNCRPL